MSYFTNFIKEAVRFSVMEANNNDREPGLHASSAGGCYKKVIVSSFIPGAKEPLGLLTKGTFQIGHEIDAWMKKAVDVRSVKDPRFFALNPFKTTYETANGTKIHGELDICVLELANRTIHIVDTKSTSVDSFYGKRKDEISIQYGMQVCTYMMSNEVKEMIKAFGDFWTVKGWVLYLNKEDRDYHLVPVPTMMLEQTVDYWNNAAVMADALESQGMLPVAVPVEDWECGYCPLFPGPEYKTYMTKTDKKNSRKMVAMANKQICPMADLAFFRKKESGNA